MPTLSSTTIAKAVQSDEHPTIARPSSPPMPRKPIVIASRASKLAQIQTYIVRDALQALYPTVPFQVALMSTEGDKNQSQALYVLGGKSLWTKELEVALLEQDVDILVHSLKDVPTVLPDGCELGAILEREDPADSLVVKKNLPYKTLQDLPDASVVGTSSVRRVAQLKRQFPKLVFKDVRGNLHTRLSKLDAPDGEYVALVLAKAGLVRLDWNDRISSDIVPPILYHAVGQAALGVEVRTSDLEVKQLVHGISHRPTDWRCRAERSCLRVLEGGCSVPVGAETVLEGSGDVWTLTLTGTVTSLLGDRHVQQTRSREVRVAEDAEALGEEVAKALIENGGRDILQEVTLDRASRQGMSEKLLQPTAS
ncbi:porphobilinogen deaminase [Gautieria morchelliformis]|nr:porphobilinogen deaminase [Gautieria morchelliformis]